MGYSGGGGSGGGGGGSYGGDGGGGFSSASPPTAGAFRFNTDSSQLEIYDGNQWTGVLATSPEQQTGGTRGLFTGGYKVGSVTNVIDYVTISTTGNAIDFGDLPAADQDIVPAGSSRTRGVFRDGNSAPMFYVTFASTGNTTSFGTSGLTVNRANGLSNETRGIHGGGNTSARDELEYITIASEGNSVDFGNLATGAFSPGTGASPTRGIFAGCATHPTNIGNAIEYINIATTGNAADFGDLVASGDGYETASSSNAIKMLAMSNKTINSIIISTLGNSTDFGDTSNDVDSGGGGCSSSTRALFGGGADPAVSIEYVQFATAGDAIDFGDLTYDANRHGCGTSNGHGGL